MITLVSLIPLITSTLIILNVYNGDIFSINPNIEYLLWYIIPLIKILHESLKNKNTLLYIPDILVYMCGIIFNIYWSIMWERDRKHNFRHRTEYYDTQTFLGTMLFVITLKNYYAFLM